MIKIYSITLLSGLILLGLAVLNLYHLGIIPFPERGHEQNNLGNMYYRGNGVQHKSS